MLKTGFSFFREKVYFDVRRERLLKVFVHLQGKEGFVFSQTNPFPVKAYIVDARLSSMVTKAEFAISEVEYTMDKYEGAPCHEYASLDGEKPEFYGFKECSKAVLR